MNTFLLFFAISISVLIIVILAIEVIRTTVLMRKVNCVIKKLNEISQIPQKPPTFPITFSINKIKIKGGIIMLRMSNLQLAQFVIGKPLDLKGDEADIQEGSLKVSSSNEEVFTVGQDDENPDNPSAYKAVGGRKGAAVLTIEADADLGEGVKPIKVEIAVEITSSDAVGFAEPTFSVKDQPSS